ncbi:MAG: DUF2431 domain-containing protein [Myxococcaceae bacterium]|nr:DUF2431 domain-containing protein [Myxococcaceae bacterium]MBH2006466.1 DUF2431 domain-containing protein [Myxococcaceae bacterium]
MKKNGICCIFSICFYSHLVMAVDFSDDLPKSHKPGWNISNGSNERQTYEVPKIQVGRFLLIINGSRQMLLEAGQRITILPNEQAEIMLDTNSDHELTQWRERSLDPMAPADNEQEQIELGEDADDESDTAKKTHKPRHKKRLFIGEGSFSYTASLLTKHPNLARSIVATELDSEEELLQKHGDFKENIAFLKSLGVKVLFGVNAKQIEATPNLPKHFDRIQFAFPHVGNSAQNSDEANRELIERFFLSAGRLQDPRDRVHIVLPSPSILSERMRREGLVYNIYSACTRAGYRYIKKRRFTSSDGPARYPRYKHVMTKGGGGAEVAEDGREYIFEKMDARSKNKLNNTVNQAKEIAKELKVKNEEISNLKTQHFNLEKDINKEEDESIKDQKEEDLERLSHSINNLVKIRKKYENSKAKGIFDSIEEITKSTPRPRKILFDSLTSEISNQANIAWELSTQAASPTMKLPDAVDFLISEPLVIYRHYDYDNRAFYPLPTMNTSSGSSNYIKTDSETDSETDSDTTGPSEIDGWTFQDNEGGGNCFYQAVADQFQNQSHPFLRNLPGGTEAHVLLRARIQRALGEEFRDRDWAGYPEIGALARNFGVVVAVMDTRYPNNGFVYHYINDDGNLDFTRSVARLRQPEMYIVKLAYTGNHYLSVTDHP